MSISFYATLDVNTDIPRWLPKNTSYLLPASSFYRKKFRAPRIPEGCTAAADWGGFVVQKRWGGELRYSVGQYVDWLEKIPNLSWASLWDLPCEPELAGEEGEVRARQIWTREMAEAFVEQFGDAPWAWVPTIQGYTLDDYRQAIEDMRPLVEELHRWYTDERGRFDYFEGDEDDEEAVAEFRRRDQLGADGFRLGIGSLCARKDIGQIHAIVQLVTEAFPGVPLHLWGVKLAALANWPGGIPANVVSTDSAAWNGRFGTDISRFNAEQKRLGYSQAQYGLTVRLPYYLERFAEVTTQTAA